MRPSSKLMSVPLEFRVNEREFRQALVKPSGAGWIDFQILIEDRLLGALALHEDFLLELREGRSSGVWSRVSFEHFKVALQQACHMSGSQMIEEHREKAIESWCSSSETPPVDNKPLQRIPVEGDANHIARATEALSRARVHYRVVGGIGGAEYTWGNVTFLVTSLKEARKHLRRAGFLESSESRIVLTDSLNGWKICLIEERS
jgi:hypothetical protein